MIEGIREESDFTARGIVAPPAFYVRHFNKAALDANVE